MGPYSTDFRLKVVRAYEAGRGAQRQLARLFGVSLNFVQDLWKRYRRTGPVEPKPHGGGGLVGLRSVEIRVRACIRTVAGNSTGRTGSEHC